MNYIGKWKFHSVMTFDDDNMPVYLTPEEYLNSPMPYIDETDEEQVADEMKERRNMIGTQIKICEDGELYMLTPLPEGVSQAEVDKAVAAGVIRLVDGAMADEPKRWELRDGELWFDTGIEGEVYDEAADSWVNPVDENGFFNFMNFRFIKED
ncbi:MAG: hypothetical protein J6A16_01305 [Oscillospiraceae bacterium]|nr:hypothetical protein [Oscillospiraceae bacterium]